MSELAVSSAKWFRQAAKACGRRRTRSHQRNKVRHNIFVCAVFEQKSAGNSAKRREPDFAVQVQRRRVGSHDSIELQDPEPAGFSLAQRISYELFADLLTAAVTADCIAAVADMTAAPDIVRMKNVQTDNGPLLIYCNSGICLLLKKSLPVSSVKDSVCGNATPSSTTSFQTAAASKASSARNARIVISTSSPFPGIDRSDHTACSGRLLLITSWIRA